MRFKIDWPSLLLGRKLTVFLCFTLYLRAIFKYKSGGGGGVIFGGGDLSKGFLRYKFAAASIWRGLFSEFYRSFWIEKQRH